MKVSQHYYVIVDVRHNDAMILRFNDMMTGHHSAIIPSPAMLLAALHSGQKREAACHPHAQPLSLSLSDLISASLCLCLALSLAC